MSSVPPDFGGFVGGWDEDGGAFLVRYGRGRPVEGVTFTPLNLLQAHKLLGDMIEQGERDGKITEEHRRQSGLLPTSHGISKIIPRDQVDEIAGDQ